MKDITSLTLKLLAICIIAAALLGATYAVTLTPIEEGKAQRAEASRLEVLSEADSFEMVDVSALKASGEWQDSDVTIDEAYFGVKDGQPVGMTVKVTTKGYNPGIEMTVGIMADGSIEAINIGSHQETPGLGANASKPEFRNQFSQKMPYFGLSGKSPEAESGKAVTSQVDALTSATYTSNGVVKGVNAAYDFFMSIYGKGLAQS